MMITITSAEGQNFTDSISDMEQLAEILNKKFGPKENMNIRFWSKDGFQEAPIPESLDWGFVEEHYPDYCQAQRITIANDFSAIVEFAPDFKDKKINAETIAELTKRIADGGLSEGHVSTAVEWSSDSLTFADAEKITYVECMVVALAYAKKKYARSQAGRKLTDEEEGYLRAGSEWLLLHGLDWLL